MGKEEKTTSEENIEMEVETNSETIEETVVSYTKEEYDSINDKYMRLYSDFENHKRRTGQEKVLLHQTANERIVKDILPILDNFKRAEPLSEGVELIRKDLLEILSKNGVKEMECLGEVFDVDKHEALVNLPNQEESVIGTILEVIETGYMMGTKIVRFPKVVIGC